MIKAKTGIKLLRQVGIVLIALPEFITTPLGVALIVTSNYLSRRLEAKVLKRLREKLTHYLAHFRHFSDERKSSAPEKIEYHALSETHLIPQQHKGSRRTEESLRPSIQQNRHDTGDNIVPHTIDMQMLAHRYQSDESAKVESNHSDTPGSAIAVIHHAINMESLSRRFEDDDSNEADASPARTLGTAQGVVHHAVNMKSLSKRYAADDSTDVSLQLPAVSGMAEKTVQHEVNVSLLSQRYETVAATPVKVMSHTINMASLTRRYGPAAGATPAPKAH